MIMILPRLHERMGEIEGEEKWIAIIVLVCFVNIGVPKIAAAAAVAVFVVVNCNKLDVLLLFSFSPFLFRMKIKEALWSIKQTYAAWPSVA